MESSNKIKYEASSISLPLTGDASDIAYPQGHTRRMDSSFQESVSHFHDLKTLSIIIISVLILVAGVNIFTAIKRKARFSLIFNIIALLFSLSLCFILFHYFGQRTSYYPMMTT